MLVSALRHVLKGAGEAPDSEWLARLTLVTAAPPSAASPEGQLQVQDALTEEEFKVPVRLAIFPS